MSARVGHFIHQFLLLIDIVFGGYYYVFLIPLNLAGDYRTKIINLVFLIGISLAQLPYRLKCPITVWRNKIIRKFYPQLIPNESAMSALFHWMGFRKLTLKQINLMGAAFTLVAILSFLG